MNISVTREASSICEQNQFFLQRLAYVAILLNAFMTGLEDENFFHEVWWINEGVRQETDDLSDSFGRPPLTGLC